MTLSHPPIDRNQLIDVLQLGGLPRLHVSILKVDADWFHSYIRGCLALKTFNDRDILGLESTYRYLCGRTGQFMNLSKIGKQMGKDARTLDEYIDRSRALKSHNSRGLSYTVIERKMSKFRNCEFDR